MKKVISDIYGNLFDSFNSENKGFSSKKLTAFAITVLVIIVHIKWIRLGDFSQLQAVLTIDFAFIATLFGIHTYQSIKNQPSTVTSTIEEQTTNNSSKITATEETSSTPKQDGK